LMVAGSGVQKYGTDLDQHQQLLLAAADILIEIYMAESGLLRVEKNIKRFGAENQAVPMAMAQLYLYQAVDIISQRAKEGIASISEGDEQRMMLMGLKRFTKYHNLPNVAELRSKIAKRLIDDNGYTLA